MQGRVVLGNRPHPADRAAAVLEPARDDAVARSPHPAAAVLVVNHVGTRRPPSAVEGSPPPERPWLDQWDALADHGVVTQLALTVQVEQLLLGRGGEVRHPDPQQSHSLAQVEGVEHAHRQAGDPLR